MHLLKSRVKRSWLVTDYSYQCVVIYQFAFTFHHLRLINVPLIVYEFFSVVLFCAQFPVQSYFRNTKDPLQLQLLICTIVLSNFIVLFQKILFIRYIKGTLYFGWKKYIFGEMKEDCLKFYSVFISLFSGSALAQQPCLWRCVFLSEIQSNNSHFVFFDQRQQTKICLLAAGPFFFFFLLKKLW